MPTQAILAAQPWRCNVKDFAGFALYDVGQGQCKTLAMHSFSALQRICPDSRLLPGGEGLTSLCSFKRLDRQQDVTLRCGRSKCTISARLAGRPVLSATRSPASVETSTCASALPAWRIARLRRFIPCRWVCHPTQHSLEKLQFYPTS